MSEHHGLLGYQLPLVDLAGRMDITAGWAAKPQAGHRQIMCPGRAKLNSRSA